MKVQIASDIHLEINKKNNSKNEDYTKILIPNADILFLLGDIGNPNTIIYNNFLTYCSENWKQVYLISGNHEYYNHHTIEENNNCIKNITKKFNNVKFLNREYVEIEDDSSKDEYLILGLTLWSDVSYGVANYMNDYKRIYYYKLPCGRRMKITSNNIKKEYKDNLDWLIETIQKINTQNIMNKKIIILSHHIPFIFNYSINQVLNSAYCSDTIEQLKNLNLTNNIKFWCVGHIHTKINQIVENINVISNPLGYIGDDSNNIEEFKKFVIEI